MMEVKLLKTEQERSQVVKLTNAVYARRWSTKPPVPKVLFGAFLEGKVVGSVGWDDCGDNHQLPLKELYRTVNAASAPKCCSAVQLSRLLTTNKHAAVPLVYTALDYALRCGKRMVWCIAKDSLVRLFSKRGLELTEQPAELILANVPKADAAYFLSEPQPKLYTFNAVQARTALGVLLFSATDSIQCSFKQVVPT